MQKYSALLGALAFLAPLGLYLFTLAPTYIPIDSAEFALCVKYWGICHPPGFPLYVAVGHFFVQIFPFGSLIYKVNLLSAIFGAGTILVVFLSLITLKVNRYVSFFLSMLFAVSAVFWEFSIAADVFTFSAFLISCTFLLALCKKPFPAFLLLGLSSSHFYITAVLAPLFYWFFWGFKLKLKEGFLAGCVFTLGFFPQAVMYWRMSADPPVNWGHASGLAGFWYFVRRQEFGSIFLLSNPALRFTLLKVILHFKQYFVSYLTGFGVVLPLLALVPVIFKLTREIKLIASSLFILVVVQLVLLSTIDPTGVDNPFQINKFYISSFVLAVLLMGVALQFLSDRFFAKEASYALLLLGFLVCVYFFANFKTHNYSNNYYSRDLVDDALSQLPSGSLAITVSHIVYFGGRYEQEVNGKFGGVNLLYFPNEKNRDNEFYKPELFARRVDEQFVANVGRGKEMGIAERYVLSVIARNLDRDIYILQGTFEEGFFGYLKPYMVPYGLWWRVTPDLVRKQALFGGGGLFDNLKGSGVKAGDLELKQQALDTLVYAVSLHSSAVELASRSEWEKALEFFRRSLVVNPKATNINNEIELVEKTKKLAGLRGELVSSSDISKLAELGNNYFTLGNFELCASVFGELVKLDGGNAQIFNNLASCQASLGQTAAARENYKRALQIDPSMDMAKRGLEVLDSSK